MSEDNTVGMGQIQTAQSPITLKAIALGSCVGITLWDPKERVGSLAHSILPEMPSNSKNPKNINPHRYAVTAVDAMLEEMRKLGVTTPESKLEAKLVGGANMFPRLAPTINVGKRNVDAAKARLKDLGIPIIAEEVGKDFGRSIIFSLEDGSIEVTIAGGKLLKRI
ncbi:MAG: chemotaxis protein CheD [Candidatus Hodarchaeota archaeon]